MQIPPNLPGRTMPKPAPVKFGHWEPNPDDYRVKSPGEKMDEVFANTKLTDAEKLALLKAIREEQREEEDRKAGILRHPDRDSAGNW